jgi:uncharacterized protein
LIVISHPENKILEKAKLMGKSVHVALNFLLVRESSTGLGVFAGKNIPANSFIFKIQGSRLHFDATTRLGEKESYCLQTGSNEYLFLEAPFCFCNHSCQPNCGIREGLSLYTIRPIAKGEELSWDYSTSMLERHWTLKCKCNSPGCRSLVRDFDFLPESIQVQYLSMGIVMPFIEREIRATQTREIFFLSRTGT